ncbi:MAG: Flp family type IVb pilin [Quisquiliibacterium sp.]
MRAGIARRQLGVTAIEYGIIAAMIAVACLVGIGSLGATNSSVFSKVANAFPGAADSSASAATPSGDAETGGGHGHCSAQGAASSGGQCSGN